MKQYKLKPGTDSRIYYLLTIKDDGEMELVFHGTDRTLTEEASVNQDGWIVTKGAMYPPLDHPNGRWQLMECPEIVAVAEEPEYSEPAGLESAEQNDAPAESQQPKANSQKPEQLDLFAQMQMQIDQLRQENDRLCNMIQTEATRRGQEPSVIEDGHRCSSPRVSPTQRRRRAVAVETPTAQAVALEQDNGNSQLMKAIGIAVASIAALVIIYNTGLLIPMGLIGLGASGLLK